MQIQITLRGNELSIQTLLQKYTIQCKTLISAYSKIIHASLMDLTNNANLEKNITFPPIIYPEKKNIEITFSNRLLSIITPYRTYKCYCDIITAHVVIVNTLLKDLRIAAKYKQSEPKDFELKLT